MHKYSRAALFSCAIISSSRHDSETQMKFISTSALLFFLAVIATGCTQSRVRRYEELLDKHVGSEKKDRIATVLGAPAKCIPAEGGERCEYRTNAGRNRSSPGVHAPAPGFGPDTSPYEFFDVIHVFYNDVGLMREWQPVVLPAN